MTHEDHNMTPGSSPQGLPQYTYTEQNVQDLKRGDTQSFVILEKVKDSSPQAAHHGDCPQHGTSQTPHLDAQLADPRIKANLQELSDVLANVVQGGMCLECATESLTHSLSSLMRDLRTAKKNGQISKAETKGLKGEAKWLVKDMKHNLKRAWKRKA